MARTGYGRVGGRRSGSAAWQWVIIGGTLGFGCAVIFVLLLLTLGTLEISDGDDSAESIAQGATDVPAQPTIDIQGTVDAAIAEAQAEMVASPDESDDMEPMATAEATEGMDDMPAGEAVSEADLQATVDAQVAVALEATQQARPTTQSRVLIPTATPTVDPNRPVTATPSGGLGTTGQNTGGQDDSTPVSPLLQSNQEAATTEESSSILQSPQTSAPTDPRMENLFASRSAVIEVPGATFTLGTTLEEVRIAVSECVDRDGGNCLPSYGEDAFPPHSVTIDTFYMEQTEVTNAQYVAFLNAMGPNFHRNGCSGFLCIETTAENEFSLITFDSQNYDVGDLQVNFPAVGVTWYGAQAYCEALGGRLPTESEWERAARGDNGFIYPWGDTWVMEYARTSRPERVTTPLEVGSLGANSSQFGVLDLAGNVAEWVFDWYGTTWYQTQAQTGALNPSGPTAGSDRVVRGGSWDALPFFARSVHRQHFRPDEAYLWLGFRCAYDEDPTGAASAAAATTNTTEGGTTAGSLGPLPTTDPGSEVATQPAVDARPSLPDTTLPNVTATSVSEVPPGG